MKKQSLVFIFLTILIGVNDLLAQAPNITYSTPQTYAIGTTITPLAPVNTGGAVPATIYGQVTTVAGNGTNGAVNGPAASASFNSPTRMAIDAAGNFYVVDRDNNLIRKITPAGVVSTFASGSFNLPNGVTVSPNGNIYIADTDNNLIEQITPAGIVTTFAGSGSQASNNGTGTAAGFYYPYGISSDAAGNFYVADTFNNQIRKITPAGVVTTIAGSGATGSANGAGVVASFSHPNYVIPDASGNLLVTDPGNNLIRKITPAGVVSTFAGTGVAGSANGAAASASFNGPGGVCIDKVGNVFEADLNNNQIRRIDLTGNVTTLVGSSTSGNIDGVGASARFFHPNDVQVNSTGEILYVTDYGNNTIRKVLITGYTIDKTLPAGLAFDATTGIISGTSTAASPTTVYTITAYNNSGNSVTTVTITVNSSLTQTITFPPIANKVYGTADFDPGATASSGLAVSYASSNTAVATIVAGKVHIVGVGPVTITASQSGNATYAAATSVSQSFTVTPAPLTITADNKTKVYGSVNPALTVTYAGFVNSETSSVLTTQPTIVTSATASSSVNNYQITVSGAAAANYSITYVIGVLTITPASLVITADNKIKTAGDVNPALTFTYSGFVNGDTQATLSNLPVIQTTATTASPAGNYPITISGAVNTNYTITYVPATLTVQSAQTINFAAVTKTYGDADFNLAATATSGLAVSYSGNNPAAATVSASGAVHITGAGTISVTVTQGGNGIFGSAPPVTQPIIVNKAPLNITANNQTKVYGTPNPTLTVTYSGFVLGETVAALTTSATASTTATTTSDVGQYPITATGATSVNYVISYTPGILTITPATRTLTFNPLPVKTYGDADFDPGATITTNETITYTSSNTSVATIVNGKIHIVGAGTVTITASVAANIDYNAVTPISQVLTVNKAPQTITFNPIPDQRKGDPDITLTATASSGLPVTITSSDPSKAPVSGFTVKLLDVGLITFTATQPGDNNYLPATATQTLNILKPIANLVDIHQIVTPNGDGINDILLIDGIDKYPDNNLTLTTRNGLIIYKIDGYDNAGKAFAGYSNITGKMQQQGTYFYELQFLANGVKQHRVGFIVLKY